ncbi:IS110 family RNA-guided transposase [Dactylosporangium cerinum]
MARVIIGMDPHKRSATVEIINDREKVLAQGRFGTDRDGYTAMLKAGRQHKDRVWAVEGCNGIGRHIAQRLVADGETVLDVPAKLSARARLFDTAQGRKTDPADAHCVAVAALRANGLRQVVVDDVTVALKLLVDRRDVLGQTRTDAVSRLHHLLLELVPGGAKQFLSAPQARALLSTVRPRDIVGRTRRQLASELITEVAVIDKKIKAANAQLTELIASTGSTLQQLNGVGPSGAARLVGDIGDISRFATRDHFASWNGTAPIDASSGDQRRHRLSRAGEPAHQPGPAHHGHRPAPPRHRGPRLLPAQTRRGQKPDGSHAGPETPTVQRGLSANGQGRGTRQDGPGRANGSDSAIQRDRLDPDSQHFGEATSRTRQNSL